MASEFRQFECPGCHWCPILPKPITGEIWCLFCGEATVMTDLGPRTQAEFDNQPPGLVIQRPRQ